MARLEIPKDLYVLNKGPRYLGRNATGIGTMDPTAWMFDLGETSRFAYHHNMANVLPSEKYGKSHPQIYPTFKGVRFIPPPGNGHFNPNFSEPDCVPLAVAYANEFFKARPAQRSVSMMFNDFGFPTEIDSEYAKKKGITTAEVYLTFVNNVAKEVKKTWPDKYVAFLAYGTELGNGPTIPMEDNVMVYLTPSDSNMLEVHNKWKGKTKNFGMYQWLYGAMYQMPNHYPHAIKDYLKYFADAGAKAFKTEYYDVQAHGNPRFWVVANLLWNPEADVDALLLDYYENAYGKEAAVGMARYFAQWEKVYERRRTPTDYALVSRKGRESHYDNVKEEDLAVCAAALKEAEAKVTDAKHRKRIEMVAILFEKARLYFLLVKHLKALQGYGENAATDQGTLALLQNAADFLDADSGIFKLGQEKMEPLCE